MSKSDMHYFSATHAFYHSTWLQWPQIHPKWIPKQSDESIHGVGAVEVDECNGTDDSAMSAVCD